MSLCAPCIYCNGRGIYVPAGYPPAICPLCDGVGLLVIVDPDRPDDSDTDDEGS